MKNTGNVIIPFYFWNKMFKVESIFILNINYLNFELIFSLHLNPELLR